MDLQEAFDAGFDAVKAYVDGSFSAFEKRVIAIEQRLASLPAPKDGVPGRDGKDGADGKDGLNGKDGIDGKDGIPGLNGKDADPATVKSLVVSEVKTAVAAIPAAKDGVDGKDGANGKDGAPGRDGVDGKDGAAGRDGKDGVDGKSIDFGEVREVISEEVRKTLEAWPKPERGEKGEPGAAGKDGRDGVDGKDGVNGIDGKDGAPGEPGRAGKDGIDGKDGRDGVGSAGALIDRSGNLVMTFTDGTQRELGIVVGKDGRDGIDGQFGKDGTDGLNGKDGAPGRDGSDGKDGINGARGDNGTDGKDGLNGKDGADGVGFDDIEESIEDDGRFIVRRFTRNGLPVAEKRHQTKMPIWRGVFDAKRKYLPGDMATWKGSLWHCNAEIEGKIGGEHWSLAVKKGRDAPEPTS